MIEHNNKIELLGYYGSDISHLQSLHLSPNIEERVSNDRFRLGDLRKAYEENNLNPFNNSSFSFLIKSDFLTYSTILSKKIGDVNNIPFVGKGKPEIDSYYIPYDFNSIRIQNDIEGFAKKGDCFYDILERYTELGNILEEEIKKINVNQYSSNRGKTVSKLFKTQNNHIEYLIKLNFNEFYKFFKEFTQYGYTSELQEISYFMLDTISNIEGKPFNQSLRVFKLNKE